MPFRTDSWVSPGGMIRLERFRSIRQQTVEALEPAVEQGLSDTVARGFIPTDVLDRQAAAFRSQGPETFEQELVRSGARSAREFSAGIRQEDIPDLGALNDELRKRGLEARQFQEMLQAARQGDEEANRVVDEISQVVRPGSRVQEGIPLQPPQIPQPGTPGAQPSVRAFGPQEARGRGPQVAQGRTGFGAIRDVPGLVLDVAEAEVEFFRLVTEPAGRFIGRALGQQLESTAVGTAAGAAGVDLSEAGAKVGAIAGPEALVPSNAVPIPIVDPAIARVLGLTGRLAARALSTTQARAVFRTAQDLVRAGDTRLRTFIEELGINLRRAEKQATSASKLDEATAAVRARPDDPEFDSLEVLITEDKRATEALLDVRRLQLSGAPAEDLAKARANLEASVRVALDIPVGEQADQIDELIERMVRGPERAPIGAARQEAPVERAVRPAAEAAAREQTVQRADLTGRVEDTFATERELAGIRESQGALPLEQRPVAELDNVLRDIRAERELAQEALSDPGTRRLKGASDDLRLRILSLDEEAQIVQGWQQRGLNQPERARELLELQEEFLSQDLRRGAAGRGGRAPAFGTQQAEEAAQARLGRPSVRQQGLRRGRLPDADETKVTGDALESLEGRLEVGSSVSPAEAPSAPAVRGAAPEPREQIRQAIVELGDLVGARAQRRVAETVVSRKIIGSERAFRAYEALESATARLTERQAALSAAQAADRPVVALGRRVEAAQSAIADATARLQKAEDFAAKVVPSDFARAKRSQRVLAEAERQAGRDDGLIAALPEQAQAPARQLGDISLDALVPLREAVNVSRSQTKLGWALRVPERIRGLTRAILGHDVYVAHDLEATGTIIGAAYGRERLIEVVRVRNTALIRNIRDLWSGIGLAGREAELYIGPAREGFAHDIRSVVQRPDLYRLTDEETAGVLLIRRSLNETLGHTERLLGVDTNLIGQTLADQASVQREGLEAGAELSLKLADEPGYWPQYLDPEALAEVGIRVRGVRGGVGVRQAYEKARKHPDVFEAHDSTGGRIQYGDPFTDLGKRGQASAHAMGDAIYRQAIIEGVPNSVRQTLRFSEGIQGLPGRFFEPPFADALRPQLDVMAGRLPGRDFLNVANVFRGLKLSWDLSGGLAIQGFFFLSNVMTNPSVLVRAATSAPRFAFSPAAWERFVATKAPTIMRMNARGLNLGISPVDMHRITRGEFTPKKAAELPFRLVDVLNDANFGRLVSYYKITTAEQWLDIMRIAQTDSAFAKFIDGIPGISRMIREIKGIKGRPFAEVEAAVYEAMNNRFGGISQALTGKGPTRTVVEQLFDIAPNWLRARASVYTNAFKGSGPERYIALNMIGRELAAAAALSTGLSWLFMRESPSYDIRRFDFLGVKTPIGTIPTIPSVSLMRLVGREASTLGEFLVETVKGEPDFSELASDTFRNFQRTIKGRESPALSLATDQAFGEDFLGRPVETAEQRANAFLKALLPIFGEDIVEAIQEGAPPAEVAARGAVGFAGASVIPTSEFDRFKEAFKEETGRDYDGSEAGRAVAEQNPRLRELLEAADRSSRERGFAPAIQREEREGILAEAETSLLRPARGVLAGDLDAGPAYLEERSRFLTFSAGANALAFAGVDFPDPESDVGKILQQYHDLSPDAFPDLDGFGNDLGAFVQARDELLDQLPQDIQDAIRNRMRFQDPELQQVERLFQQTRPLISQLYEDDSLGRFRGIGQEREEEFRDFMADVRDIMDAAEERSGQRLDTARTIESLGRRRGKSSAFIRVAILIRPGSSTRDNLRNPQRDIFLLRHIDTLRPFYGYLYESSKMRRAIFRLGQLQEERAAQPVAP